MRVLKRVLTFLIALAATLLALAIVPTEVVHYSHHGAAAAHLVTLLTALIAVRLAVSDAAMSVWNRARLPFGLSTPRSEVAGLSDSNMRDFAVYAQSLFQQRFGKLEKTCADFYARLLDPAGYTVRITESIDLRDDRYVQAVTRTVLAPNDGPLLIPVMRPRKGRLVDELTVTVNDQPASTLSFAESKGLMLYTLSVLYESIFSVDLSRALPEIFDLVIADEEISTEQVERLLGELSEELRKSPATHEARALVSLIRCLASSYFIVVFWDQPHTGRLKVRTCHTTPVKGKRTPSDRLRILLGLHIRIHNLRLPHAMESANYHLRTQAPEGLYIYYARLRPLAVTAAADQLAITVLPAAAAAPHAAAPDTTRRFRMPRAHTADSRGLDYVHAYVRDLDGLQGWGGPAVTANAEPYLSLRLEMRERPPGVLSIIALLSFYLVVLTWVVGHFHGLVFPHAGIPVHIGSFAQCQAIASRDIEPIGPDTATAWPTILFGVPAIVSGWIVSRFTEDYLRRVSLVTIGMMIWFVANAGAAVLIAAIKTSRPTLDCLHVGSLYLVHSVWGLLMLSTGMHFALICVIIVSRSSRYLRRLRRG